MSKLRFVGTSMRVKISDIVKYSKGVQINGDDLIDDGEYIYLNGGINPSGRWNSANVGGNTVTISEGGNSSGYINFITEPFWCGAHCYYLYDGPKNTRYLYYALKSQQDRLFAIRSGACMPNIKKADLGKFEFEYDYDEQHQENIVSVLSKIETVISARKRELELLDDLIKARFVEMFVSKNYPLVSLDDLSIGRGEYGAQSASIEYDSSRPRYVRITDINDDGTLNDDFVSSSNTDDDKQYKLIYGDFLFARMGATVGKTYAYKEGNQIYAGYLIRYKLNLDKVMPEYLCAYTRLEEYWNWVKLNQSGAAQPGINAKKYGSLQIPVPPLSEQKAFQSFVSQVDKSKVAVQKAIDEAQLLFDSLMQKYFG